MLFGMVSKYKTDLDDVRDIRHNRYLKRNNIVPIVSKQIISSSQQGSRLRVRLMYVFSDGREVTLSGIYVNDQDAADQKLIDLESIVLFKTQELDAEKSEDQDSAIVDTGEASQKQIAKQYLIRAMQEKDPFISLNKLTKVLNFITNQGWTPTQIKTALNLTNDEWDKITTRYNYLKSVEAALINYQDIINSEVML